MKNIYSLVALFLLFNQSVASQPVKIISECTVTYKLSVEDPKADQEVVKSMTGTTKTLYVKGTKSRSDLKSSSYSQTIFTDNRSDTVVILRELGNSKYISYLDRERQKEQNRRFEGVSFRETEETKNILGYDCRKTEIILKDSTIYSVFSTTSVVPSAKDYEFQFKEIKGIVLQYETMAENNKTKVRYVAEEITLTPVQNSKFDLPKIGYRIL